MPTPLNIGTRDVPIKLAKKITALVNDSWEKGEMLEKVTPVSQDLLKFWFMEPHIDTRNINFHKGQKQAILNTIFLHEILGTENVKGVYENIDPELLAEIDMAEFSKPKYNIPKYAVKMATGTGKTWVMHALVIWQYLNAKYEKEVTGKYSKNFLLIAPGLIVYERLLDAYLGKESQNGERDFERSDIFKFQDVFLPPNFKDEFFGFVQGSVARKEEIESKVTGDGMIAIANWHLFLEKEKEDQSLSDTPLDDPSKIVKDVFPIRPGTAGGNELNSLDASFLRGKEIEYLKKLDNLVVINDEAHHIHENKTYGEIQEVEWQKSLNAIANEKGRRFMQLDFSATPFDVTGSGQKRTKHFFPHIICDFDLQTAIRNGLVKIIAIDKRKEIVDMPLDFKAIREGKKVVGISDGQKLMIRAGLKKLKILEEHFVDFTKDKSGLSNKHPKMLIMCEDTTVTPFVTEFLLKEGYNEDDVMQIDSNKKGELPEKEWQDVKQRLFNLDQHKKPKIIVSVLMLREGFDVNNVCVIVPLRASQAAILLEQTIGRGLRLMWREPEFTEIRQENLNRLLRNKKEPLNYIDLLTIIEHPAFIEFYDELLQEGLIGELDNDPKSKTDVLGDIITAKLKDNYKEYDIYWPVIMRDAEEEIKSGEFTIDKLEEFKYFKLSDLQGLITKEGEKFFSEEVTVKTRFGDYIVNANLFDAQSYNEYLEKLLQSVVTRFDKVSQRKLKAFPTLQINNVELIKVIDRYIRTKLFNADFDPFKDNNWKILLLKNGVVTQHIVKEVGKIIFDMQNNVDVTEAKVEKRYFSEVPELKMRESYSLEIVKTIYERLAYPSNKGGFEKSFMEYTDSDSGVDAFIKVNEFYHNFATVNYVRTDGLLSLYSPDFIVKTGDKIFVVETKATKDLTDPNVKQKQLATLDWINRVNKLNSEDRMECTWEYILLGENHFYGLKDNGASISEILELAKVTEANAKGTLF